MYSLKLTLCDRCITHTKCNQVALFRSEVMTQFGDFAGALSLMQSASQLDPSCPLPYVNAGRAFTAMGDLASARKHLLKAEQVNSVVHFK
jgi:predicted Zn-dependent protease